MGRNLASLLTDSAARTPERTAIKLDDAELTYAQLDGASAHVVGLLEQHGFQPGDRVGVMLPNVPYFPVVYYGILRAGGVVVPMNVLLKEREVAYYLGDSGAKLLFAWAEFGEEPGTDVAIHAATPLSSRPRTHRERFARSADGRAPSSAVAMGHLATLTIPHGFRFLVGRIATDDFGTGHSSLSYRQRFPLHHIKIHRSLVRESGVRRDRVHGDRLSRAPGMAITRGRRHFALGSSELHRNRGICSAARIPPPRSGCRFA